MTSPGLVVLTRRVSFSSGHRYWLRSLDEAGNRALFGKWASPYNHGHNYILDVSAKGAVDPTTGMVVNIKDIDDVLQDRVVAILDQKSINDEIPHFRDRSPCLENLLDFIRGELNDLPGDVELCGLRLEEAPGLWANWDQVDGGAWHMTITRTYEFAASHRLHVPSLSEETNRDLFGKCNNPAGHGHNYMVEVTVSGEPDPKTGMMIDLMALDAAVEREVVDRYDHKNLNEDLPEFRDRPTTSEAVAQEVWSRLLTSVPGKLEKIRLFETARSCFEIRASDFAGS